MIIWDGLPDHRSRKVRAFLREGGATRLYLAQLPSYAPELKLDEATWHYLKNVELKNVCCHSLDELRDELRKAIARLRHKPNIIQGFTCQVYLDIHA